MNNHYVGAIYIRLSNEDRNLKSEERKESNSITNQRNYIRAFVDNKPEFKDARWLEFIDDGYSGINFDRPQMQELLDQCKKGKINCVIVKDFSRFGRNYIESGNYLEQLFPFLQVRFIAINDGYDSNDYLGKTGGMDVAFKNFIYEMYSRDLSEKVKGGVNVCMKKGEYYSGCVVYGYRKSDDGKSLIIDEGAAWVVRKIFEEMASGKNCTQVAKMLNDEQVPTRLMYKQSIGEQLNRRYSDVAIWDRNKILSIVHDERYKGDMVYKKSLRMHMGSKNKYLQPKEKWIVIPNHHEAIVSRELFDRANDNIKIVNVPIYDRTVVKRGQVVCGHCRRRMALRDTSNPYYECKYAGLKEESTCGKIVISKQDLEDAIFGAAKDYTRLTEIQYKEEPEMQEMGNRGNNVTLIAKLQKLENDNLLLYEDFRLNKIGKEAYLKQKGVVTHQIEELNRQMEQRKEAHFEQDKNKEKFCSELGVKYKRADSAEDVVNNFVNLITVYERNRIEVEWSL